MRVPTFISASLVPLLSASPVGATSFSANASINPGVVDTDLGRNRGVSAAAAAGGASAGASAGPGITLSADAASDEAGLIFAASGASGFLAGFNLQGRPAGAAVPLIFNFGLSGTLEASSGENAVSSANTRYFLNGSIVGSTFQGAAGSASVSSGGGLPGPAFVSGNYGNKEVIARVTPKVTVNQETVPLTDRELSDLGLDDLEMEVELPDLNTQLLVGALAAAIDRVGIPDLNILPGTEIDLGLDVDYFFDTDIKLQSLISGDIGSILGTLVCVASASPDAAATCDFGSTLALESVTVPHDYLGLDISQLSLVFDSGITYRIGREAEPGPPAAVAEPAGLGLLGLGYLAVIQASRRWRRRGSVA